MVHKIKRRWKANVICIILIASKKLLLDQPKAPASLVALEKLHKQ